MFSIIRILCVFMFCMISLGVLFTVRGILYVIHVVCNTCVGKFMSCTESSYLISTSYIMVVSTCLMIEC